MRKGIGDTGLPAGLPQETMQLLDDSPVGLGLYYIRGNVFDLVYTNAEYYRVHCGSKEFWDRFRGTDALNRVLPEDRALLYEAWERLLADTEGKMVFDEVYRCLGEDEQIHWIEVRARLAEAIDGERICYACYTNIDRQKQAEAEAAASTLRLKQELERQEAEVKRQYLRAQSILDSFAGSYIAAVRINVTRNSLELLNEQEPLLAEALHQPYDEVLQYLLSAMPRAEDRRLYREQFSREALLAAHAAGQKIVSQAYYFQPRQGAARWVSSTLRLTQRPGTNDIIAFNTIVDKNRDKILQSVVRDILAQKYDFIAVIDVQRDLMELLGVNKQSSAVAAIVGQYGHQSYDEAMRVYAKEHVVSAEMEECIRFMSLTNVAAGLEKNPRYSATFTVCENGELRNKQLDYYWIDRECQILVLLRVDFTEVNQQQLMQEARLREALNAAQQASLAKSEFLSRMSHEIRTPMNAIIGLDTIALQEENLSSGMRDHLQKIGISARFLLSLINDILDMSRIESGRMLLRSEAFDFRRFIDSINTMLYAQCQENEIDYECRIKGWTEEIYIGDALKLQQVLINILGNAVKFTPAGGRIRFLIEQTASDAQAKNARLQFTIADTGIGMDEDFMPHIFDAFTQESRGNTSSYGGTGLGLAISHSLVRLMDGSIQVHSVKGAGTDFTIQVMLGLPEQRQAERVTPQQTLENLRTLIVDDDVIDCQHAEIVLRQAGISAAWVHSGAAAVKQVKKCRDNGADYQLIIIDWKMPDMDGIETAQAIRSIVGPDVTIIILTAYDWSGMEQRARRAGVDSFIRKPIFASSVLQTYEAVCQRHTGLQPAKIKYDFTGHKVLVVEDNEINAEIAKTLLEMQGFGVDVAVNGVEAIQCFTASPVGGYDAILMDIRMPFMDGLEATKTIRSIRKEDSKTIPIVAMSANAFDEDVQKSLECGMNAHLSKPLEMDKLYALLDKLIRANPRQ